MLKISIKSYQLIDMINPSAKMVRASMCMEKCTKHKIKTPVNSNEQNTTFTATKSFGDTPGSKIDFAIASNMAEMNACLYLSTYAWHEFP
jgi:hypothetical protein